MRRCENAKNTRNTHCTDFGMQNVNMLKCKMQIKLRAECNTAIPINAIMKCDYTTAQNERLQSCKSTAEYNMHMRNVTARNKMQK